MYITNNKICTLLSSKNLNKIDMLKIERASLEYDGLFVKKEDFYKIASLLQQNDSNPSMDSVVFESHYDDIKRKTTSIIDNCFHNQNIDSKTCDLVSFAIKNTLINFNASCIFEAINIYGNIDDYLYSHSTNVAFLNGLIGKWLGLDDDQIQKLVKIGLLHDIGKTRIPDKILNKPGKLTDSEFEVIKLHPVYSYNMLVKIGETDDEVLQGVMCHHEKMNGTGYPDNLTGKDIPLYSRITTISDIYDAMVSKRVYKRQNSPFEVFAEFSSGRFSNLDTKIVNLFLRNMPSQFVGKNFIMSDGQIGQVLYINPHNYQYPIIKVDNNVVTTNENFKCLCVKI